MNGGPHDPGRKAVQVAGEAGSPPWGGTERGSSRRSEEARVAGQGEWVHVNYRCLQSCLML